MEERRQTSSFFGLLPPENQKHNSMNNNVANREKRAKKKNKIIISGRKALLVSCRDSVRIPHNSTRIKEIPTLTLNCKMASLTSSVAFAIKSSPKLSSKTNSRAQFTNNNKSASSFGRKNQSFQIVRAEGEAAPAWSAPKLDPNTPSPIFGGSTGGLLRKAQVRLFAYIDRLIVSLRVNASARWMLPSDFLPLKQTVSQNQGNSFSWFWYIFS